MFIVLRHFVKHVFSMTFKRVEKIIYVTEKRRFITLRSSSQKCGTSEMSIPSEVWSQSWSHIQ